MAKERSEKDMARWTLPALFVLNATAMVLELVAARLLQPFLGSSNTVWTVIISIMLLANALGNWLGGRKWKRGLTFAALFAGSAAADLALLVTGTALEGATGMHSGTAPYIAAALVFISIPCVLSGMASPLASTRLLGGGGDTGKKSGRIYAVITAGSLIGTVTGGLLLIPGIGTLRTLRLCTAVLGACGAASALIRVPVRKAALVASVLAAASSAAVLGEGRNGIRVIDTADSHIKIYEAEWEGEPVRMMEITGGFESAVYLDPAKRDELVFSYPRVYDEVFRHAENMDRACMIGGAAYQYPRHLVSHYPGKSIDVVELDPGVTEVAREWFFLDDFIAEYGTERLGLYNGDGRLFLEAGMGYDVIFNDAFQGEVPAKTLATKEAAELIKSALRPGGVYATNIIGSFTEEGGEPVPGGFLGYELDTLESVFRHVWVYDAGTRDGRGNYMVFASDTDYGFDTLEYRKGACGVLTDSWFPEEL